MRGTHVNVLFVSFEREDDVFLAVLLAVDPYLGLRDCPHWGLFRSIMFFHGREHLCLDLLDLVSWCMHSIVLIGFFLDLLGRLFVDWLKDCRRVLVQLIVSKVRLRVDKQFEISRCIRFCSFHVSLRLAWMEN